LQISDLEGTYINTPAPAGPSIKKDYILSISFLLLSYVEAKNPVANPPY
jgi:hypothetical protein